VAESTSVHQRSDHRLVLASASPRRRALLDELGIEVLVLPADIDETPRPGVAPWRQVVDLAGEKAGVVAELHPDADVIAADTEVVLENHAGAVPLGKPRDREHAARMLADLSGRTVHVVTGLAVRRAGGNLSMGTVVSAVTVRDLTATEIDAYLLTGDADDKAGGLAVQGEAAGFVPHIEGCYTNVVGLPLCRVAALVAPHLGWTCHGSAPSCDAYAAAHGRIR